MSIIYNQCSYVQLNVHEEIRNPFYRKLSYRFAYKKMFDACSTNKEKRNNKNMKHVPIHILKGGKRNSAILQQDDQKTDGWIRMLFTWLTVFKCALFVLI